MDGNISLIRNRNYIMNSIVTTGKFGNEVVRSMAPVTAGAISENVKYVTRGLLDPNKRNQNTYSYKSSKELIKDSINSLKDIPPEIDEEEQKSLSKINEFINSNKTIISYNDDNIDTDIKNVRNEATLFLRTNIKDTISVISAVSNTLSSFHVDKLSTTHIFLLYLHDFDTKHSLKYYNHLLSNFNSTKEKLSDIKNTLSVLDKFEHGAFQVNNKYNQLRTVINTIGMFSQDYYHSKLMGNENEEVMMQFDMSDISPVLSQIAGYVKMIIPAPIQAALNETESLLKITPVLLNDKFKKMSEGEDHLKSAIGTRFYKKIEVDPYEKGNVSYDGITRRALLNAIPSGLAKILNTVSGETDSMKEKVFDYGSNTFMEAGTIMQHAKDESEFQMSRTDTPVYGYKKLVIQKLKEENLFSPTVENEVNAAIEKINTEKLLPSKLVELSKNDDVDRIMKEAFKDLSPHIKTRFMHYVFNVLKTPEEIISENESYHNVSDIIGMQNILPKEKYDFKNELSKYLIGKNYNGLNAFVNQKMDDTNPYEPGSLRYRIVEGIRSGNRALSELLFGTPEGKRSEISIIGEKSLMFVGRTADKLVEMYRTYISSDRRSAKILKEISETGIVKATTDYLKLVWDEIKQNGIGKWANEKLIAPLTGFFKVNVYDKIVDGYTTMINNIKNQINKVDDDSNENKVVKKNKITRERVYQIKIKKNFKTFNETMENEILKTIADMNEELKTLSPILDRQHEEKLINIVKEGLEQKLKQSISDKEEQMAIAAEQRLESMSILQLMPEVMKDFVKIHTNFLMNMLPARIIRSMRNGKKQAKDFRPDIEKRSFMEKLRDMIDYKREEKAKRTSSKWQIFKNASAIAGSIIDMRLITPFKTFNKILIENRKSLWSIMKNTVSIIANFYTKFMIPIKLFGFYTDKVLGAQIFLETKRFAFAVRRKLVKEALKTIKEAIKVNRTMKKVYKINPEYEKIGFTVKKFNIVGGYLDDIYEKVTIVEYISGYQQGKNQLAEDDADDEKDRSKVAKVVEKTKRKISERIKDRLTDIQDMLMNCASKATTTVLGGLGHFAKGTITTLFTSLFKNTKVGNIIEKTKSIFKGTKTDMDARIEHVYVIGGTVSSSSIIGDIDIDIDGNGNKKKKKKVGDTLDDLDDIDIDGKGKKSKAWLIELGIAAGAYALGKIFSNDKDEEETESTINYEDNTNVNSNNQTTAMPTTEKTTTVTEVNNSVAEPAKVQETSIESSKNTDTKNKSQSKSVAKPVSKDNTDSNKLVKANTASYNKSKPKEKKNEEKTTEPKQSTKNKPTNEAKAIATTAVKVSSTTATLDDKNVDKVGIQRKAPTETVSPKLKNFKSDEIVTASSLQANASLLSASMIPVTEVKNVDNKLIRNYQLDKDYNEKIEKEFVSKLTSKEADEYYANKNAAILAAKMRMNENGVIETLMSKDSFGALARGSISPYHAKLIVDEYVKKSGIANVTSSSSGANGSNGSNSDGSGGVSEQGTADLADGDMFGKISAKYETGKGDHTGARTVSRVAGDAGGASYGIPQYTTNQGSAKSFSKWLAERYPEFGNTLSQLSPGTSQFDNAWRAAYDKNPKLFAQAQIGYIVEKSTIPFINSIKSSYNVNMGATRALQEAAHSTVIQFGLAGAKTVFGKAGITSSDNENSIIKKFYAEKRNSVGNYKFLGCSKSVQKSVYNRFTNEEKDLLAMAGQPAVNLQTLLGKISGTSNADAATVKTTNKLTEATETASVNKENIRGIIKNIKTMQTLKDDPEVKQLIEIINILGELSENTTKLANDDIMLRYSDKITEDTNKSITNIFTGGHIGKLA